MSDDKALREAIRRSVAFIGRIDELESKLAKAVELALEECPFREGTGSYNDWWYDRRAALAELKGQNDE